MLHGPRHIRRNGSHICIAATAVCCVVHNDDDTGPSRTHCTMCYTCQIQPRKRTCPQTRAADRSLSVNGSATGLDSAFDRRPSELSRLAGVPRERQQSCRRDIRKSCCRTSMPPSITFNFMLNCRRTATGLVVSRNGLLAWHEESKSTKQERRLPRYTFVSGRPTLCDSESAGT